MYSIFMPQHFNNLNKGSKGKYAAYYPIQYVLVVTDFTGYQQASKNKKTIPDKSSDTNTKDIRIVMILPWEQNFFGE